MGEGHAFPFRALTVALLALSLAGCKQCDDDDHDDVAPAAVAPGPAPAPPPPQADLDVDADRNGLVDAVVDEADEDLWTSTRGAVFYHNIDDDDNDNVEDAADGDVDGPADALDLARILVRPSAGAPPDGTVTILVSAAAQGRIRLFRNSGGWSSVYSTGPSFSLPVADLIAGEIELGIEAREKISPVWNGQVTLTLELRDNAAALLASDAVLLRCAPWLMATNLWPAEELCVVNVGSGNSAFRSTLQSICAGAGVSYVEVPGSSYSNDRWVQDSHETGAVYLPASGAPRRRIDQVLQLARWRPVDAWCKDALFGPDFDFTGRFSSNTSSMNYGGNLEITGPLPGYPWGRLLVGGGTSAPIGGGSPVTRRMVQVYRDYLNALDVQGPYVEVSTEWLAVGHTDEHTMLVPAPAHARGWALLVASPALARAKLQAVKDTGGGAKKVFEGRSGWETTVDAVLADTALMAYNDEVQVRMDGVRALYKSQLGLADFEILDLPVLFEDAGGGAAAYNPGVVNMVVLRTPGGATYVVVPDPEGPDHPADVWQDEVRAKLQSLFTPAHPVTITFADVFFSYHTLLGEAHCGTNTVRTPPAEDWWDD